MLSAIEQDYILGIINTYKKQGFKYYLAHTVTETNNDNDICVYLCKDEILAYGNYTYSINNALVIRIDSSSRNDNSYNSSTHDRITFTDSYSGLLSVNMAEFIYSNAKLNYETTQAVIVPDLLVSGSDSAVSDEYMGITTILIVILFLYIFIKDILRIK